MAGQLSRVGASSDGNLHRFLMDQGLGEHRTHFAAKIVAVHGGGRDSPPIVDIQPIVKQMNGAGKSRSHGTVFSIPVTRNIGGDSVIINDPRVGDVGIFSVLDRDHSSAQANDWAEANPGSKRRGSMSDAVYHGPLPRKGDKPKQWIWFKDDGVEIQDRNENTLVGGKGGWKLNGVEIDRDGNIKAPGEVTAKSKGTSVSVSGHKHPSTDKPTPGT
ncbi:hypothetical protein [Methylobacterium frigidaeris]|uniref:hypothetical protein n=1 Tax=Methylobacterium frigidaeris TaxID=2038277 RepID=UPI001EDE964C|nr:hypothetical protein [Methylobacterium frigidaeris]